MPEETAPHQGNLEVTLRLDKVRAIKNPELIGKAEWWLRLWINGVERWRSDSEVKLGEGEEAELGQEIVTQVAPWCDELEVVVRAREHDMLNFDDHAAGEVTLQRALGFTNIGGITVNAEGPGAHLELHFSVDVAPID